MLNKIMTTAAIPFQAARFTDPPPLHAVTFDSIGVEGGDVGPGRLINHDCTVELYAPSIVAGDDALHSLQSELDAHSIRYTTQGWYWLSSAQRYQEIIEFSYIEKT